MEAEAYLRSELASPYRREYVAGEVYPLHDSTWETAGSSQAHNLIGGTLIVGLSTAVRQRGDHLYAYNLKLYLPSGPSFYYPDVMVTRPKSWPEPSAHFDTAPYLLAEIVAEHSDRRDKVEKVAAYTAIPTLQIYLIVEQGERRVYLYTRQDGKWPMRELTGGSVPIDCLDMELTLDDNLPGRAVKFHSLTRTPVRADSNRASSTRACFTASSGG